MNKISTTYKVIVKTIQLLRIILKPVYRIIQELKRASLFGKVGIHADSDITTDRAVKQHNRQKTADRAEL